MATIALVSLLLVLIIVNGAICCSSPSDEEAEVCTYGFTSNYLDRGLPLFVRIAAQQHLQLQDRILGHLSGTVLTAEQEGIVAEKHAFIATLKRIDIKLTMAQNQFFRDFEDVLEKTGQVHFEWMLENRVNVDEEIGQLNGIGLPRELGAIIKEHYKTWMRETMILGDRRQYDTLTTRTMESSLFTASLALMMETDRMVEYFDVLGAAYKCGDIQEVDPAMLHRINYLQNLIRYAKFYFEFASLEDRKAFSRFADVCLRKAFRALFKLRVDLDECLRQRDEVVDKIVPIDTQVVKMQASIDEPEFVTRVKQHASMIPQSTWPMELLAFLRLAKVSNAALAEAIEQRFMKHQSVFSEKLKACSNYLEMMQAYYETDPQDLSFSVDEDFKFSMSTLSVDDYLLQVFKLWKVRLVLGMVDMISLTDHAPKVLMIIGAYTKGIPGNLLLEYTRIRHKCLKLVENQIKCEEGVEMEASTEIKKELANLEVWGRIFEDCGGKVQLERRLFVAESPTSMTSKLYKMNRFAFGLPIGVEILMENGMFAMDMDKAGLMAIDAFRQELIDVCQNAQFSILLYYESYELDFHSRRELIRLVSDFSNLFRVSLSLSIEKFTGKTTESNELFTLGMEKIATLIDVWFRSFLNALDAGLDFLLPDFDDTDYEPAVDRWFERQGSYIHMCIQKVMADPDMLTDDAALRAIKLHIKHFQMNYEVLMEYYPDHNTHGDLVKLWKQLLEMAAAERERVGLRSFDNLDEDDISEFLEFARKTTFGARVVSTHAMHSEYLRAVLSYTMEQGELPLALNYEMSPDSELPPAIDSELSPTIDSQPQGPTEVKKKKKKGKKKKQTSAH